jgi:predicted dienelactone hydrolase
MRALEALLLLADLLALLALSAPQTRATRWLRHAPAVAPVEAAAQALMEGSRWQMAPAYALTALLFLVWLKQRLAATGVPIGLHRPHRIGVPAAIGAGVLGLSIAIALPLAAPVFRFPHPTGPYQVGTVTYHWVDAARSERFAAEPTARRELMVQIWYPAKGDPSAPRAAYMTDADAVTATFARIHHWPAFAFRHFKFVTTNGIASAPVTADQPRYPVLLFLEGATGFRQMNTFQVEHLVSHGYVVVAIDQPGAAANVVFPDGHQVSGLTLAQVRATVGPSYMPVPDADPASASASAPGAPRLNGRAGSGGGIIPYIANDVVFTLDRLADLNRADPGGILTGKLDLQRAGAFGVSLGGIVVAEACRGEARLQACLMLDAPMPIDVVRAGLRQPSMWITRDAKTMRLEREQAGGWSESEIEAHQTSMRAVYEGLSNAGYFVRLPGAFHSNFTDVANWTPLARRLHLTGPIDGERAHAIINAYATAFFDRHLSARPATLLDGPASQYPEAQFESRRP